MHPSEEKEVNAVIAKHKSRVAELEALCRRALSHYLGAQLEADIIEALS